MSCRVLVSGATGFIGAAIARQLHAGGWTVRATGRAEEPQSDLFEYQPANLSYEQSLWPLLQDVAYVVHAAGLAHQFGDGARNTDAFYAANVQGTENIIRCAAGA